MNCHRSTVLPAKRRLTLSFIQVEMCNSPHWLDDPFIVVPLRTMRRTLQLVWLVDGQTQPIKIHDARYPTHIHTNTHTHHSLYTFTGVHDNRLNDRQVQEKKQLDGFSNHSQTGHLINWQHINLSICMIVVHKTMIWDNIIITMDRLVLLFDTVTSSICIHNPIYHYAILTRSFSGNNTWSFSLSLSFSISFSFPLCRSQQEILSMCNWTIIPIELRYNQHWTFP